VVNARSKFAGANFDRAKTPEGGRVAAAAVVEPSLVEAVLRAKTRLDTLDYYPEPVRVDRVRIRVAPWFFRIPGFRRYHGYAFWRTILLRSAAVPDDLVTHELCHIWQGQHRAAHMAWKHVTTRYRSNPYEIEARRAVDETRRPTAQPGL
jgi:hypothetical protein